MPFLLAEGRVRDGLRLAVLDDAERVPPEAARVLFLDEAVPRDALELREVEREVGCVARAERCRGCGRWRDDRL